MIGPAALLVGAALANPSASRPDIPSPPPALAARLKDGYPDPDDLAWLRGAFPGATEAQKAEWKAVRDWERTCAEANTVSIRAELAAMGRPVFAGTQRYYPAPLCAAVSSLWPPPDIAADWNSYLAANREAGRLFAVFFHGAKLGFESFPFDPAWAGEEARTLMHATVREQVYRRALSWNVDGPSLDPLVWTALERRLSLAVVQEDAKNTAMLKAYVGEHGWPTMSRVGERASGSAWLLVQHADLDPAFQLKALKLMEPLVPKGETSKSNYAYLYDRVMLKIAGHQRYGTQMTCRDGKRVPLPLDDGAKVDAARTEMGLGPIADYIALMDKNFGPCPSQ